MKIKSELQNVYHFSNNEHSYEEVEEFNYYQVEHKYILIDNDININLGVLAFQNGNFNLNYKADKDIWNLYSDASEGFVETIYGRIGGSEQNKIEYYVNIHLDDILDEINENTKKLKAYINNDKDKLKQILILLSNEFNNNEPDYDFAEKNITETI